MIELTSHSAADTHAIGRRLAGLLQPGDIVLLSGKLGSGKTMFAAGVGDGLGVDEPVLSPSYVIVKQYTGFLPLVHVDVYRLSSRSEFEDLDVEGLASNGVLIVEWGGAVESWVGPDHLCVNISVSDDETRALQFVARGTWQQRRLGGLAE